VSRIMFSVSVRLRLVLLIGWDRTSNVERAELCVRYPICRHSLGINSFCSVCFEFYVYVYCPVLSDFCQLKMIMSVFTLNYPVVI